MNALLHEKLKMGSGVCAGRAAERARKLLPKKIYDIARGDLDRYLNVEKRALVRRVEDLWEKYAVSTTKLKAARASTMEALGGFVTSLGYLS